MIRVFEPKLNFKDYISVLKTLYQNNISGTSPIVEKFEKHLAQALKWMTLYLYQTEVLH